MTVYIKGNEGRLIGEESQGHLKYIEGFSSTVDQTRPRQWHAFAVKGPTAEMAQCKKIIQEVCETGSIADRPISQQGAVLKEQFCTYQWGSFQAQVNAFSIDEESLPEEFKGIFLNDQVLTIEIPCPTGQEGRVIGRGGATIRDIVRVL